MATYIDNKDGTIRKEEVVVVNEIIPSAQVTFLDAEIQRLQSYIDKLKAERVAVMDIVNAVKGVPK